MTVPLLPPDVAIGAVVLIVLAACAYILLTPDDEKPAPVQRRSGGDLGLDHRLGSHRQVPAWGCKACEEERKR